MPFQQLTNRVEFLSGKRVQACAANIDFFEFTDHPLAVANTQSLQSGKPSEVPNRWLYVFKEYSWGKSISAEIQVSGSADYMLVDWKNNEQWIGIDTREATVQISTFCLNLEGVEEVYFYLSRIQLPYARILYYLDRNKWLDRFTKFSDQKRVFANQDGNYTVNLVDFMGIALTLQEKLKQAVDEYHDLVGDERFYLSDLALTVAENYAEEKQEEGEEVWEWLSEGGKNMLERNRTSKLNKKARKESIGEDKYKWIAQKDYLEARADYDGTVNNEIERFELEAKLITDTSDVEAGKRFLEDRIQENDFWLNQYMEKLPGHIKNLADFYDKFADLLQQWAPPKIKYTPIPAFLITYEPVLIRTLGLTPNYLVLSSPELNWIPRRRPIKAFKVDLEPPKNRLPKIPDKFLLALELINIAIITRELSDSKSNAETAQHTLALTAGLSSSAVTATKLMGLPEWKAVSRIAPVASYFSDFVATWRSANDGDWGIASSHAASGSATVLLAYAFSSVAKYALLWGIIGIGLFGLGIFLSWYYHKDPLQKWFEESSWGINSKGHTTEKQSKDLMRIAASPRVDIKLSDSGSTKKSYTLDIILETHHFFPHQTSFKLNIEVQFYETLDHYAGPGQVLENSASAVFSKSNLVIPGVKDKVSSEGQFEDRIYRLQRNLDVESFSEEIARSKYAHFKVDLFLKLHTSWEQFDKKPVIYTGYIWV